MSATALAVIEAILPGKPAVFHPIEQARMVIGRAPDADLRIDIDSVSRRHAELFQDPFGRWWLKDLKSRNGTKVNGTRIDERTVGLADVIRVGEATLRLRATAEAPAATGAALPSDAQGGELDAITVEDSVSSGIVPGILSSLLDFSEELGVIADAAARRRLLCSLLTSEKFAGIAAVLVLVPRKGGDIRVVYGPCVVPGNAGSRYHVSRTLLRKATATGKSVLGTNSAESHGAVEISIDASAMAAAGIACPVEESADAVTCLYLAIDPKQAHRRMAVGRVLGSAAFPRGPAELAGKAGAGPPCCG